MGSNIHDFDTEGEGVDGVQYGGLQGFGLTSFVCKLYTCTFHSKYRLSTL